MSEKSRLTPNAKDLIIVLVQVFLQEAPRGIVVPTLYPYIKSTGAENAEFILSLSISLFSVGRLVSAYPWGLLADSSGSSRYALLLSTVLLLVSNVVFSIGGFLDPKFAPWVISISRFFVGFGCGTIGVSRAFMARISTKEERLKYVAWNSLVQYIGFTLSPILSQAVKLALPKMENKALLYGFIPGMIMVVLSTIMIFVLLLMRPNDPVPEPETIVDSDTLKSEPEAVKTPEAVNPSEEKNTAHERKLWACFILYLFLNFVLRGILGILETFGAQQFQTLRTQGSRIDEDVVDDSAEFFVIMGCLGIGTFLILPRMVKKFTPFYVLLFGIACISIASVLLIPHILRDDFWYMFVPAVFMIWSVGSPITQTLTISSYSQMMGSKPQGEAMGWLSTAGSLGRIVFPFLGGISYLLIAWINLIFSILCIIAVILFRVYYGLDS